MANENKVGLKKWGNANKFSIDKMQVKFIVEKKLDSSSKDRQVL
jgi:hypothetical protein